MILRLGLMTVAALALLPCGEAAAQLHKDERRGFQFKPPREFGGIALNPTETLRVARYQAEDADHTADGRHFARFEVWFWPGRSDVEESWKELARYGEVAKDKSVKIAGEKGREAIVEGEKISYLITVLPQEDGVYAFLGEAATDRFDKHRGDFSRAARSFKRIKVEQIDLDTGDLGDQEQFLQEQIAKLPPDWEWDRSERYLYLYNADKTFIRRVSKQIEAIRDEYEELFPPEKPVTAISIVRVTNDADVYRAYGGPANSNGYWSPRHQELVLFDRRPQEQTLETLNHEAFHQYIFYSAGELSPHSWYNEGHGDYFGGAKMSRSYKVTGYGPRRYTQRHPTVKRAWRESDAGKDWKNGGLIPLRLLMKWSQAEYYGPTMGLAYAQGWALIYWLREDRRLDEKYETLLEDYFQNLLDARDQLARKALEEDQRQRQAAGEDVPPEYGQDLRRYYRGLDDGAVQQEAFQRTFGAWTDADWDAFEQAYFDFVGTLPG